MPARLRRASVMRVHADAHEEYRRRHDALWPEMRAVLEGHGVLAYSIFLDPGRSLLFAYVEFTSQEQWDAIARTEVCRRWWTYMRDIMEANPDDSPISEELSEVFRFVVE